MTVRLSRLWWGRDLMAPPEELGRRRLGIRDRRERLVREASVRARIPERVVALGPRTHVEIGQWMAGIAGRRAVVRAATIVGTEVGAEVEVLGPELHLRRRLAGVGRGPRAQHTVAEDEPCDERGRAVAVAGDPR